MLIFYGGAQGRQNVPAKSPINELTENVLNIFRSLDPKSGFLGIILEKPFVLQLITRKKGIHVELLDSSVPAVDFSDGVDRVIVEELIKAAGNGEDVFGLARQRISSWQHLHMGRRA